MKVSEASKVVIFNCFAELQQLIVINLIFHVSLAMRHFCLGLGLLRVITLDYNKPMLPTTPGNPRRLASRSVTLPMGGWAVVYNYETSDVANIA